MKPITDRWYLSYSKMKILTVSYEREIEKKDASVFPGKREE